MALSIEAFFAGWGAGVVNIIVGHPFDTGKVRAQTGVKTLSDDSTRTRNPATTTPGPNGHGSTTSGGSSSSTSSAPNSTTSAPSGGSGNSKAVPSGSTSSKFSATGPKPTIGSTANPVNNFSSAFRVLYRGVTGPILTVGWGQSFMFGSWRTCKDWLERRAIEKEERLRSLPNGIGGMYQNSNVPILSPIKLSPLNVLLIDFTAGTVSGFLNAVWSFPLICVKVRAQLTSVSETPMSFRDSLKDTLKTLTKNNLLARGYIPHLIQESIGRGFYMSCYTYMSGQCHGQGQAAGSESGNRSSLTSMKQSSTDSAGNNNSAASSTTGPNLPRPIAGALAGIAGWCATYPCDVIRQNMLRSYYFGGQKETNFLRYGSQLVQQHGLRQGLFAGIGFCIIRAAPVAFFTLPAYDYLYMMLKGKQIFSS